MAHESHRLARRVTPFFSAENRAAQLLSLLGTGALFLLVSAAIGLVKAVLWLVPMRHSATAAGRTRIPRVMLPAFLVVVLAISGYYIYRFPARPSDGLNTRQPEPMGTSAAMRTQSPDVPARIGDPATVSQGMDGKSTDASAGPSSPVAPLTDGTAQVTGAGTSTTEAGTPDAESQTPAQPAATSTSLTDAPSAKESRATASQTAVLGVVPKQTVSNPSTATDTHRAAGVPLRPRASDAHIRVPPDAPRPQVCTATVAALGLCSLNTSGESPTNVPITAESRRKAPYTAAQQIVPRQTVSNPSTATNQDLTTGVPRPARAPDAPRPWACTEAVAALALCNLNTGGESK